MKKTAVIIGYGSIGKKHLKILKNLKYFSKIYVLTKQKINKINFISELSKLKILKPDYFIVSSKSNDHLRYLKFIEKNFEDKIVLVEKPLFNNYKRFKVINNKVFVGYNLRYHPVLQLIKRFVANKKVISINISCHSYLPYWRKNIIYSRSNSAKKNNGGVVLELSHELDYLRWIFKGIIKISHVVIKKISNLKIQTEDYAKIIGSIGKSNFNIFLNFFCLKSERKVSISGNNYFIEGDLINNTVEIIKKNKKSIKKFNFKKDFTYIKQHEAIMNNDLRHQCDYNQGNELMKLIEELKKLK